MSVTGLLDLPDDLLLRCLAGAGGISIGSTGASCVRLRDLCRRLGQLPVFSSALSTQPSLQKAIQDAATRALSGCFGGSQYRNGWDDWQQHECVYKNVEK